MKLRLVHLFGFLWVIASSCTIKEPVGFGDYWIENRTDDVLMVEAFSPGKVDLLQERIDANSTVRIYRAEEGTGGHVLPSNFFSDFRIFTQDDTLETVVYRGVKNEDWETRESVGEVQQLYLVIE